MSERPRRATEAFFGRRRGKPLSPLQADRMETLLPELRLDLAAPAPTDLATLFPHRPKTIRMEIGFGGGEHLIHRARENPETGFIGVEPFVNGMAKLVRAVTDSGARAFSGEVGIGSPSGNAIKPRTSNIRLYDDDATRVLDWLPAASIDHVDLLYPDPWPKPRHFKRRFVSNVNLDRLARVLKPGGRFHFASDIDTYVDWTLGHCDRHPAFEWLASGPADWKTPYEGWPGTRYEAKALGEGRTPAYLRFRRV